jgi:hypothetical protein
MLCLRYGDEDAVAVGWGHFIVVAVAGHRPTVHLQIEAAKGGNN